MQLDLAGARVGEDLPRTCRGCVRRSLGAQRVRERARPDPEADCDAGGDGGCRGSRAEEPLPGRRERHDVLPLGRRRAEDPVAQPLRRRRRRDRPGEGGRRLAERRELGAAVLALAEVRLVGLAVLRVERVERVGRGQVVGIHDVSSPGSPSNSRNRARPMNIRLLMVPRG